MEEPVNKRRPGAVKWMAVYLDRHAVVWAVTEGEALQKAHEHFKPKKANKGLVHVSMI
ncbi:hypothetical protein KMC60_gp29 [Achromobacter phage vB_AxyP_19-32_Axy11]|uniref:Uncharacterized protein n=1 Tax=Achromobacter phage vB_AxyP_19-32_Axy11 TaxID=2591042 RepID=A0A514CUC0_9CAUD|nr:hypothetical protein KMC60_gp29 [Achromobacter phage vB_AxyP_19-32_Axy11]QDH84072.1 hypothetical protein Axy11_029 [Achromobacter phage vB_AxyP_19-32_Axy11]